MNYSDLTGHKRSNKQKSTENRIKKAIKNYRLYPKRKKISVSSSINAATITFNGSMQEVKINIKEGKIKLKSRHNNYKISKSDLKSNYKYAAEDVTMCIAIYKTLCSGTKHKYDFEKKHSKSTHIKEHKMHLYYNFQLRISHKNTYCTDMERGYGSIYAVTNPPTYEEFCKRLDASGRK